LKTCKNCFREFDEEDVLALDIVEKLQAALEQLKGIYE